MAMPMGCKKSPCPITLYLTWGKNIHYSDLDLLTLLHQQHTFGQAHRKPVM